MGVEEPKDNTDQGEIVEGTARRRFREKFGSISKAWRRGKLIENSEQDRGRERERALDRANQEINSTPSENTRMEARTVANGKAAQRHDSATDFPNALLQQGRRLPQRLNGYTQADVEAGSVTAYGTGEMDERIIAQWDNRKEIKRQERVHELQSRIYWERDREENPHEQQHWERERSNTGPQYLFPDESNTDRRAPSSSRWLQGSSLAHTHAYSSDAGPSSAYSHVYTSDAGPSSATDAKVIQYYQQAREEIGVEEIHPALRPGRRMDESANGEGKTSYDEAVALGSRDKGKGKAKEGQTESENVVPIMMRGRPCSRRKIMSREEEGNQCLRKQCLRRQLMRRYFEDEERKEREKEEGGKEVEGEKEVVEEEEEVVEEEEEEVVVEEKESAEENEVVEEDDKEKGKGRVETMRNMLEARARGEM